MKMNQHDVFMIAEKYMQNRTGKQDTTDFTDEEEAMYMGYIAGILKGLKIGGAEVEEL